MACAVVDVLGELIRGQGAAEVEALGVVGAEIRDFGEFAGGLDAFRDHGEWSRTWLRSIMAPTMERVTLSVGALVVKPRSILTMSTGNWRR